LGNIIGYLILFAFLGLLFGAFFKIIWDVVKVTLQYFGIYSLGRLNQEQVRKLKKYSPYFRKLKQKHQKKFLRRMSHFIAAKQFVSRGMSEVTEEMKVVVAALSVQITFGPADLPFPF
jgi:excinuclease UvrABC helicase subunit UvrB